MQKEEGAEVVGKPDAKCLVIFILSYVNMSQMT